MNKSQLIDALAGQFEGSKKDAGHALESVLDTIMREVAKGEKVAITGFGAFEKQVRPSRMVRNPRTGERKRAKKTAVPKFRAGAEFKQVVSGEKKLPKAAAAVATRKGSAATKSAGRPAAKKTTGAKRSSALAAKKTTAVKSATKKSSPAQSASAKAAPAKKTASKSTASKSIAKSTARQAAKKS